MNDFKNFKAKLDEKKGLWDNIHAKRKRGEKPNPPGHPDRPTAQDFKDAQKTSKKESVEEKKLTPAEIKKREEIAKAMERDNPGMDMGKKMAIATATAKKVAEEVRQIDELSPNTLSRYVKKADKQADKASDSYSRAAARRSDFASDTPAMAKNAKKFAKRDAGAALARKKLANQNEAVDLDKASKSDMLCKECGDQFGKPTNEKCMYDAYDKLGENWVTKEMYEGLDITEISLDMLTKKISNSGMATTKKANKMDKTKNDLAALKARLAGKPALAKEAKEDDEPASPDEASMALKQLEFIEYAAEEMMDHIKSGKEFPEWFQNKLSKAHSEIEGLHSSMGEHGEDEEDMKEAVRRKGAPKMKGDFFAMQRAKDAELNKALGRTKTGRKKPVRQMTSTQRSLAQLRREETELDEGISNNMRLISKIKNSGVVKSGSMSKDTKPAPKKEGIDTAADKKPEKFIKPDGKIGVRMVPMDKNIVDKDK